jgi:hypothetical protein
MEGRLKRAEETFEALIFTVKKEKKKKLKYK